MMLHKRSLPRINPSMPHFNTMLKRARPYIFVVLFFAFFALPAISVFAADGNALPTSPDGTSCANGTLCNPLQSATIQDLLGKVLDAVIAIGTVVVTIMLVYCGFLFVVAQGNEEKVRDARSALVWTVIGALILLGAKVISTIISATVATL